MKYMKNKKKQFFIYYKKKDNDHIQLNIILSATFLYVE